MTIAIGQLIDDAKCYEMVRELRWPQGVRCPHCTSGQVVKNGHDTTEVSLCPTDIARRVGVVV